MNRAIMLNGKNYQRIQLSVIKQSGRAAGNDRRREKYLVWESKIFDEEQSVFSIVADPGRMQTQRYPREKAGSETGDSG
ncbi:MAG: hypothetical protein WBO24_16075 [Nitrospirales bacterium]